MNKEPVFFSSSLLPCPFCGGGAIEVIRWQVAAYDGFVVECTTCHARGPELLKRDAAENAWNTRHPRS